MFEQFIKERRYLSNVSPRTCEWYRESFKWLNNPDPTEADLKAFVIQMREKGLKATSCNNRIRAVNAYLHWRNSPLHILRIKEPQKILPTFSQEDISRFLQWKSKTFYERRLQCLLLLLADSGARISEALALHWEDVDWDNLLLKLEGKGNKQRLVPFSETLRKYLWRFKHDHQLVFCTKQGSRLGRRDCLRDTKRLCRKLNVKVPERTLHAFRHSYAIHALRKGSSVFHVQRVLGHSTLDMTRRYMNLNVEDLQKVHQQVSLLSS